MLGRLTTFGWQKTPAPAMRSNAIPVFPGQSRIRPIIAAVAIILLAIVVGNTIAYEKWLYIAALAGLILALQWPIEAALAFYVFLVPFGSVATLGGSTSGTTLNWVVGVLAGMGLLVAGIVRKRLVLPSRAVQLWLLFLLWIVVTAAWAASFEATRKQLPTAIALILLYALAASWRVTKRQLSLLCYCAVAGGLVASIAVIHLYSSGVTYTTTLGQTSRASLVFGQQEANPNGIAAELLLPFSLTIAWFVTTRHWRGKLAALGVFGIMGYAAFVTMSRAFVVALAVMLSVYLWRLGLNRRILVLGSTLCLLLLAMPSTFFLRLREALATHGAGRLDIWSAGLVTLKAYWLAGAGFANFPIVYQAYAGYAPRFSGFYRGSHNIYLNVAVELGVLGMALMIAAFWYQLRGAAKLRYSLGEASSIIALSLEAACWAMLANGFFGDIMWSKSFWVPWLLLAMAMKCEHESPRQAVGQPASEERIVSPYQFHRA